MNVQTIPQNTVLLHLRFSFWNTKKTIHQHKGNKLISLEKRIIPTEYLTDVNRVRSQLIQLMNTYALPFPIRAFRLVPQANIDIIQSHLERHANEILPTALHTFWEEKYTEAIDEAMQILGPHFDTEDYPKSFSELASNYRIVWQFYDLRLPEQIQQLDPKIFESQVQAIRDQLEEARVMAINALRQEFTELVQHASERLAPSEDGKTKRIHASVVKKITDFIDRFQTLNIFDDQELQTLINQYRSVISSISVTQLRTSDAYRAAVKKTFDKIKTEIDENLVQVPRRAVLMDDVA